MPLTFAEYTEQSAATAIYPEAHALSYVVLGLNDELVEVYDAITLVGGSPDLIEAEMGDVLWYVAATARETGTAPRFVSDAAVPDSDGPQRPERARRFVQAAQRLAGRIAGHVKKAIRDHDGTLPPERMMKVKAHLNGILHALARTQSVLDLNPLSAIAEANLDKLLDRQDRGVLRGDGDHR